MPAEPAVRRAPGRAILTLDLALKLALVVLLLLAVVFPDWEQFEGKAIGTRILTYPLSGLLVPAGWWLFFRGRPYPFAADVVVILPFVIDTAGNAANLYNSIWWWDDANHFVNWGLLTAAFLLVVRPLRLTWWNLLTLGIGFGAATAIAWEVLEYFAFIRNSPELETAYTDTLGDLVLGLCGSTAASGLMAVGYQHRELPARS